jgi:hypothetical protein
MSGTNNSKPMLTLTNDHVCSHTDGGKSTYVFYTDPTIALTPVTDLNRDAKVLEGGSNDVKLDRD